MTDCTFCRIVAGSAAGSVVYRGEDVVAFLDLFPVHPGHTLVVPRSHVPDLRSCPLAVAARLFRASAELAPAIVAATGAQGFNIWTADGKAAGQVIFHLHLHILPRFEQDAFGLRFPKSYPKEATRSELDTMAAEIRSRL